MNSHITPLTMDDFLFEFERVKEEKTAQLKTNSKGGAVNAGKETDKRRGNSGILS